MVVVALLFIFFMSINSSEAKDLGNHGVLHPIEEEDPIALIQQKLKKMEEKGELKKHNFHIQKRTKESVERPSPVKGISKATKNRRFTYDPTFTVVKDIKDHRGRVIHAKGTKINPLETVTMTEDLVFINGDDPSQKALVFDRIEMSEDSHQKQNKVRLILVKGSPLSLSEEFQIPVYFDQGGLIVKKLGIQHVPAIVTQGGSSNIPRLRKDESRLSGRKPEGPEEKLHLNIEEIKLKEER